MHGVTEQAATGQVATGQVATEQMATGNLIFRLLAVSCAGGNGASGNNGQS